LPERSKFDISWMAAKPRVVDRIRTHLHPQNVRIVEEYVTPAPDKAGEDTAAKESAAGEPKETAGEPAAAETTEPSTSKGSHKPPAKSAAAPKDE